MFKAILTGALTSGAAAGLLAVGLHAVFLQPVLLHAELYESGTVEHFASLSSPGPAEGPGFSIDAARDGLTALFMVLIYCGYGALLGAAMALAREYGAGPRDTAQGVLWGAAGFAALQLAPAFGLPPEVPGVASAEIGARQVWWTATVLASAAGLGLIGLGRGIVPRLGGAMFLLAPHVWGAPVPAGFAGAAPPELASLFAVRALAIGLAAWCLLGALLARSGAAPGAGPEARPA